jgi:hypothetical protein
MVKLQLNEDNSTAKITVPIQLARLKGWTDGEDLEWREKQGDLTLKQK